MVKLRRKRTGGLGSTCNGSPFFASTPRWRRSAASLSPSGWCSVVLLRSVAVFQSTTRASSRTSQLAAASGQPDGRVQHSYMSFSPTRRTGRLSVAEHSSSDPTSPLPSSKFGREVMRHS